MMMCSQCGQDIAPHRAGLISGRVMGDACTESWFHCPRCDVYMLATWRDSFTGGDAQAIRGPFLPGHAQAKLALIRQCDDPTNDRCTCPAHRAYFGDALDA